MLAENFLEKSSWQTKVVLIECKSCRKKRRRTAEKPERRKWKKFLTREKSCGKIKKPFFTKRHRTLKTEQSHRSLKIQMRFSLSFEKDRRTLKKIQQPRTVKGINSRVLFWPDWNFNMRVWSWLRMNAGGVLNTCKSNEALRTILSGWDWRDWVADGWVTRG